MGELLRRYWQPIERSEELPAGAPPKPLKILGEDLVLFRDNEGRLGPFFIAHDAYATESQGTIQDRTREHLVSTDAAIVAARKLLLKAIRDIQDGREPPLVFREPDSNQCPGLIVLSEILPSATDAKEYLRELANAEPRKAAGGA